MRAARIFAGIATLLAASVPIAAAAEAPAAPACTTPPVSAPSGRFCGLQVTVNTAGGPTDVYVYKGIRYGRAKRWTAPAPVPPPSTLVAATLSGPICPQNPVPGVAVAQSEDCLFINVWTPTRNSARNLPVMVFIHGGSFTSGAGNQPVYRGARLAGWGDVVLVTFNYRLGALGFLGGGSGADHLAGNYGFEDQQLALEWVRRNIRSFGGDPSNVTIFGESAGAMSVGIDLVAPGSRRLFKNAIMESNPYGIPLKTQGEANAIRHEFDFYGFLLDPRCDRLACLETLPARTIVELQGKVTGAQLLLNGRLGALLAWAPYIDGRLIFGQPNQAAIAQPVIAGTNRDEGTLFVFSLFPKGLSDALYTSLIDALFKKNATQILAQDRYKKMGIYNRRQLSNVVGDYLFSCATRHVLGNATAPHFGYAFSHAPSFAVWPNEVKQCNHPSGQVCHAVELPFVFRNPISVNLPPEPARFTVDERRLVDAISAYWTDFARAGDPNSGGAAPPQWPAYGTNGIRQVLNLTMSQTRDAALNCPLWDRIGYGKGAASLY